MHTTPVPKKGAQSDRKPHTYYKSVLILEIFQKLVLKRIMQIEAENDTDITRKPQHGFKANTRTNTAGLAL
jgi:hypothetical protein